MTVIRTRNTRRDQRSLHFACRSFVGPFTLPTVPGPLHCGRARHGTLAKTLFALRFRLKPGSAPFRCGLLSAKRFFPTLRYTPARQHSDRSDLKLHGNLLLLRVRYGAMDLPALEMES